MSLAVVIPLKRAGAAIALVVWLLAPVAYGRAPVLDPLAATVAIFTIDPETQNTRFYGTGFIALADGTILTDSHVTWLSTHNPRYRLLVIIGDEFYSGTVVCATSLHNYNPDSGREEPQRDIAVLRVSPSDFPFSDWTLVPGRLTLSFKAHTGSLPTFPVLTLSSSSPSPGTSVHARGWAGIPYGFTSESGTVDHIGRARDGTAMLALRETLPALRGLSGSAILDSHESVVGMLWGEFNNWMWATDVQELRHPCGNVNF